ncbi:hypothetical protein D3C85_1317350 [compost metagenome]
MRRQCILRLRAEDDDFLAARFEVGQVNACKLVIRFTLVHLLLDAAAALGRIGHVLFEFVVGRRPIRMENL